MAESAFVHDEEQKGSPRTAWVSIGLVALSVAALHMATNGRYGFHRDELQFLSDARHLDWGFVPYPPMTAFLEHILLGIFGLSMVGLRLFSVIAQVGALVVTALMAKELGGGRLAQVTAALTVALSPHPLSQGTEFQYSSFDYLWWVLIAYFTIRLLRSEDPRWWLAIGAAIGLGLETKYSICFFIAGILGGVVLTWARRYLLSVWFWGGIALALVIFLPNLLWLVQHDFISYKFLQHIHVRDVGEGRAANYLKDQLMSCINVAATPLCLAGVVALLRSARYRMVAWMYLIPFGLFWVAKGRGYYVAGTYPMLMAMGAATAERWLASINRLGRWAVEGVYFAGLLFCGAYITAVVVPLASGGPLKQFALARNGDFREEFGWNELVATVAGIRDSLPPEQQASLGITVANYGEQGAIEMLGPAYHLPPPISNTNSAWLRGYPTPQPTTLIVLGLTSEQANRIFTGCRLAGHDGNAEGIKNEESQDHQDIFVCGPPRMPWPELWAQSINFG